jgi:hypothetical protein
MSSGNSDALLQSSRRIQVADHRCKANEVHREKPGITDTNAIIKQVKGRIIAYFPFV